MLKHVILTFALLVLSVPAFAERHGKIEVQAVGDKLMLPDYNPAFVVSESAYNKGVEYYKANYYRLSNREKFVIVDFSLNANKRRFLYIDMADRSFTTYLVAHGIGSDPDGDGDATVFSDRWRVRATALGAYRGLEEDTDRDGDPILRLKGLDPTNDNAEDRDIVIKGGDYVNENTGWAGRSNGAPVMDPTIVQGVIDRLKDGTVLFFTN